MQKISSDTYSQFETAQELIIQLCENSCEVKEHIYLICL